MGLCSLLHQGYLSGAQRFGNRTAAQALAPQGFAIPNPKLLGTSVGSWHHEGAQALGCQVWQWGKREHTPTQGLSLSQSLPAPGLSLLIRARG